jgi:ribosomal protein S6--L-glutamate ligase
MSRTTWILTDERYAAQRMPRALAAALRARGADARTVVAGREGPLRFGRPPWAGLAAGDVVVPRTRDPLGLALLAAAEAWGARCLLDRAAVEGVRDKAAATATLARHGVPMPPTYLVQDAGDLRAVPAAEWPLLLKPVWGDNARGIVLAPHPDLLDDLPEAGAAGGLLLGQRYVDVAGVDLKVYVAGDAVWGVRRVSPLRGTATGTGRLVAVDPLLAELARRCARTFRLPLLGLDVLEAPDGPLVVDVNDFPNYTGVPDAAEAAADVVLASGDDRGAPAGTVRAVAA